MAVSRTVARLQYHRLGSPEKILFIGCGIGDDLLCSCILHELRRRGVRKTAILSRHPELFVNNPDVFRTANWNYGAAGRFQHWGYPICFPHYGVRYEDSVLMPREHMLLDMCRKAGIVGEITLRPYLYLTAAEKAAGKRLDRQAVIHSAGTGKMLNKEWIPNRFQRVCEQLRGEVQWIQLGAAGDPPLDGALDLRGKTTLREAAAILANSLVFVGLEGFLMHLARAMDCRSVIVHGGFGSPEIVGYQGNEDLTGNTPCAPCWRYNTCDFDHACMEMIHEDAVIEAARRQIDRFGEPLPEITATIHPLDSDSSPCLNERLPKRRETPPLPPGWSA